LEDRLPDSVLALCREQKTFDERPAIRTGSREQRGRHMAAHAADLVLTACRRHQQIEDLPSALVAAIDHAGEQDAETARGGHVRRPPRDPRLVGRITAERVEDLAETPRARLAREVRVVRRAEAAAHPAPLVRERPSGGPHRFERRAETGEQHVEDRRALIRLQRIHLGGRILLVSATPRVQSEQTLPDAGVAFAEAGELLDATLFPLRDLELPERFFGLLLGEHQAPDNMTRRRKVTTVSGPRNTCSSRSRCSFPSITTR